MRTLAEIDKRSYVIVTSADHGLGLMRSQNGPVRLRIDRTRRTAALVGLVHAVEERGDETRAYHSIWTPVDWVIAEEMATKLHHMTKDAVGDHRGYRVGWKDAGYDGEVADWFCFIQ
jgi:hypothetical protein